jgi:hypothetical protein
MTKKTVHYYPHKYDNIFPDTSAFVVCVVDHPDVQRVSNTMPVNTSKVLFIRGDGYFETVNTIYVPINHEFKK